MYRFNVKYWNENEERECSGIVAGKSYGDAANRLDEYFGKDLISMTIYEIDDIIEDEDIKHFYI